MRILFVENHPEFTATVVATFLGDHEVVVVPTIAAARERILAARFDVVLVDYDLDDGKGDELVRWIRTERRDLKLVAVSARDSGNEALISAGADAVCSKVRFSQIQSVIQSLVGNPTPTTRPRIYADFNGIMGSPRDTSRSMVPLDTWGSLRDLSNAGTRLHEGTQLVIHDASDEAEDLEADATAYYDPARQWWYAELEDEYAYVPARDRSPVTSFLCLGCRTDLGPEALISPCAVVQRHRDCPQCGLAIVAAIAPP